MNKSFAVKAGVVMAGAVIGCAWIGCLFWLGGEKGLVNSDASTLILDSVVVGLLSLVFFASNPKLALLVSAGWLGGQLIFLVWDGMSHGRSPQMFQPTNFDEALVLGLLGVIVLNWSIIPAALLGCLFGYLAKDPNYRKNPRDAK